MASQKPANPKTTLVLSRHDLTPDLGLAFKNLKASRGGVRGAVRQRFQEQAREQHEIRAVIAAKLRAFRPLLRFILAVLRSYCRDKSAPSLQSVRPADSTRIKIEAGVTFILNFLAFCYRVFLTSMKFLA